MFVIYGHDAMDGWGTWYWGHPTAPEPGPEMYNSLFPNMKVNESLLLIPGMSGDPYAWYPHTVYLAEQREHELIGKCVSFLLPGPDQEMYGTVAKCLGRSDKPALRVTAWGYHRQGPTNFIVFCDEITGIEE